jgi:hypothetical protein
MTDKQIAQEALDVQDACNLSGVVHSFARVMSALSERGLDTRAKNRHPAAVLFANKIADLTGSEHDGAFSVAYAWAQDTAAKSE